MRLKAAFLALLLPLSAGCVGGPSAQSGSGVDPSLPGVVVDANATWEDGKWRVAAEARNEGPRTYRINTYCQSPFSLEARAEEGEGFQEVQCLAYTEPIEFKPGDTANRRWTVDADDLDWSGQATFVVRFQDAEGLGRIRVELG